MQYAVSANEKGRSFIRGTFVTNIQHSIFVMHVWQKFIYRSMRQLVHCSSFTVPITPTMRRYLNYLSVVRFLQHSFICLSFYFPSICLHVFLGYHFFTLHSKINGCCFPFTKAIGVKWTIFDIFMCHAQLVNIVQLEDTAIRCYMHIFVQRFRYCNQLKTVQLNWFVVAFIDWRLKRWYELRLVICYKHCISTIQIKLLFRTEHFKLQIIIIPIGNIEINLALF